MTPAVWGWPKSGIVDDVHGSQTPRTTHHLRVNSMQAVRLRLPSIVSQRAIAVLVCAVAGFAIGFPSPVSAIYFGAGYYSNLEEYQGSEKVSSLSIAVSAYDWWNCNGYSCTSSGSWASINWSIYDGSSTFEKIVSAHLGDSACAPQQKEKYVYASPSNYYGTDYVYFDAQGCIIPYTVDWVWFAGMCETSGGYTCFYYPDNGPHIRARLTPPSNSAFGFSYNW